jgi:hypothetical protein
MRRRRRARPAELQCWILDEVYDVFSGSSSGGVCGDV